MEARLGAGQTICSYLESGPDRMLIFGDVELCTDVIPDDTCRSITTSGSIKLRAGGRWGQSRSEFIQRRPYSQSLGYQEPTAGYEEQPAEALGLQQTDRVKGSNAVSS